MGTAVQSKAHMLGYHSMRDLNEDSTSCSWLLGYEDRTLSSGHYFNGFLPSTASDAYGKDVLRRTMLGHEAIFRNQVYELHRVYRIQRDLMEEVKRKELHDSKIPTESSLSSSPLGYQTPESVQKWRNPSFRLSNTFLSGASASASPFSCNKEKNASSSSFRFQNERISKNCDMLESRPSKARRKLLDLELPADEYSNTEGGEHDGEEDVLGTCTSFNDRFCRTFDSGAMIILNSGDKVGTQVGAPGLVKKNGLTDLNEPAQMEGTNAAVGGSLGQVSCHEEFVHTELKSQFVGFPKEAVLNSHHVNGMPNNLQSMSQRNGKGWLSHVLKAGYNNDKINTDLCRDRRDPGSEVIERGHRSPSAVLSDSVMATQVPNPYTGGLSSNLAHPWSPGVAPWRTNSGNLSQKNAASNMLPSFKSALSMNPQPSKQSHVTFTNGLNSNRSNQSSQSEFLKQNGDYLGSSSGSKELPVHLSSRGLSQPSCSMDITATSARLPSIGYANASNGSHIMETRSSLNLNAVPPNNLSHEQLSGRAVEIIDLESKNDGILPWLRPKSACSKEETNVERYSKSSSLRYLNSSSQSLAEYQTDKISTSFYASNTESSSQSRNYEAKQTEIGECPKILGVPIFPKPCSLKSVSKSVPPHLTSSLSSECDLLENRRVNMALDINLPCDPDSDPDIGKQIAAATKVVEKKCKDTDVVTIRPQIDLNLFANEDEFCLVPHVTTTMEKVALDIDLEVSFPYLSEDDVTHVEGPITLISAERKVNPSLQELVRVAAEAIVSISSSDLQCNLDYNTDKPSEVSTQDPLGWFAEIVSSCGNTLISNYDSGSSGKGVDGNYYTSQKEIDYFESMTLKLTECKEEDYIPKPLVPENIEVKETGTSLLTNRPRRGQARRGRQRKDFQRDILPGLVSLSRHEVTEDLQTFGGLMRATGHSWNLRLGRRASGRNGSGRGKRRSLVSSSPTMVTRGAGTPMIQQINNAEVGLRLEDRNLQGWGKTTRRPRRRLRCPAGHLPTLPVT